MNHSIYGPARTTHLKIVVLGLLSAAAVAVLTLLLHFNAIIAPAAGETAAVLKAGKPVAAASSSIVIVR